MKKFLLFIFLLFMIGCQSSTQNSDENETVNTYNSDNSTATKIQFPPQPPKVENL